jgi:glutamate-1-semialdehyde 2,1-aminomutase
VFCAECCRRGVFLHPIHNWFLSAAHKEADIDEALAVTEVAFGIVKEQFGD